MLRMPGVCEVDASAQHAQDAQHVLRMPGVCEVDASKPRTTDGHGLLRVPDSCGVDAKRVIEVESGFLEDKQ